MSEAREPIDSGFDKLLAAGRSLWLAGLGAVAEVEEGGRGLFDHLVERGRPVEGKQKKMAETVSERASKAVRDLGKRVEETVEFESRGMLKKLNLMTREDVKILSARLATLSKKIDEYVVRREAQEVPVILNAEGKPARKVGKVSKVAALKQQAAPRPRPVETTQTVKTMKAATVKARGAKKG